MNKQTKERLLHALLHIFWLFPIKKKRIVFQSFNGTDYSDSCKPVAEYLNAHYPDVYEMYWVSKDTSRLTIPDGTRLTVIRKHSLKFMYLCLTAQVIVCNILPEKYLPIRKKQIVANIWHGMPYKVIGKEFTGSTAAYQVSSLYMSHNRFYTEHVIRQSFGFDGEVLECGIPRNDILFAPSNETLDKAIRAQYGLDGDKKIALFAPTFRGKFAKEDVGLDYEKLRQALHDGLGGEWVIFYRAHPMLSGSADAIPNVINVTHYPDMAELLAVSDVLLTDYSSSMWDFSLTGRPVFLFAPDLADYAGDRGFYFDMEALPFPLGHSNDELAAKVAGFDAAAYREALARYMDEMGNFEKGHATETLVKKIVAWCR